MFARAPTLTSSATATASDFMLFLLEESLAHESSQKPSGMSLSWKPRCDEDGRLVSPCRPSPILIFVKSQAKLKARLPAGVTSKRQAREVPTLSALAAP